MTRCYCCGDLTCLNDCIVYQCDICDKCDVCCDCEDNE